ncbi:MAG: nicotinate (nicotinamide) nucleotide adenylyltransferase [Rhodoferax sp.]|nr:nicotinate (nicotinamide) nucleotide adenylyltransferase [Rhodoferax sp.]
MTEPAARPLRIGVFGGAFDPPHLGHRALAQTAIAQLALDRLLVIPTGHAWHKARPLTAAAHRLAMVTIAFSGLPQVQVDARETLRTGASYTVDTLRELHAEHPQAAFFLVIGQDQADALPSWHASEVLPSLAIICVAGRAATTTAKPHNEGLGATIPGALSLQMPAMAVSATDIRQRVAAGKSIAPLVFEPVARYIDQHLLYRPH